MRPLLAANNQEVESCKIIPRRDLQFSFTPSLSIGVANLRATSSQRSRPINWVLVTRYSGLQGPSVGQSLSV
jgi:hypothetical protein